MTFWDVTFRRTIWAGEGGARRSVKDTGGSQNRGGRRTRPGAEMEPKMPTRAGTEKLQE